ncbi:MAG: hypothetical protein LBL72_05085 [Candidatus Accumulibacter sp.]|nr:hypothetical protein [Accumulibacter sp.]
MKKNAVADRGAERRGTARLLPTLALLALTALPLRPALADKPRNFVPDVDGRCTLWAPSILTRNEYAVRYTGGCKNDRAEGRGKAEWLYRYAGMKVKARWEGEFRNGVFLDGQDVKGWVEPLVGDRYVVEMGKVDDARIFFVSTSPQDAPMVLCRIDRVALVLAPNADAGDEDAVRRLMRGAARHYRQACPKGARSPNIGVFTEMIAARTNGLLPTPVVFARYDAESGELTDYRNDAADAARQERRDTEFAQKLSETKKRFDEFSKKSGIVAWVTTRQLDENPFRWEGKTVGVVVRLDRMLTRDAALVRSGLGGQSRRVQLTGITPDFPESRRAVLVAAEVGTRQPTADGSDAGITYTTLRRVGDRVCEDESCGDWLVWSRGEQRLTWGEAYAPR